MAKLLWDQAGEKTYETGVKQGVLYPIDATGAYPAGYAWNGLVGVTESPSGAEPTPFYADNIKYLNLMSNEEFGATIEAFMYPTEFAACDGSASPATGISIGQQTRTKFGMAYITTMGNDLLENAYGEKIHLVYGAQASPSEKAHSTINETPEIMTFSWDLSTTPVEVLGHKPTATLEVDSVTTDPAKYAALKLLLFGDTATEARLPLPNEIVTLINAA